MEGRQLFDHILIIIFAIIAVSLLIKGINEFVKRETFIYLGRYHRRHLTLIGIASDIVSILCVTAAIVILGSVVAFWIGRVSSGVVAMVFVVALFTYQVIGVLFGFTPWKK
jgi:hypothetical protein